MTDQKKASAPGKIILSGEYAVLFGYAGIAIPSEQTIEVMWTGGTTSGASIAWVGHAEGPWTDYARLILKAVEPYTGLLQGTLTVTGTLPLGKGMGSSTALIIAICRCLLGEQCAKIAHMMENQLSPGNSGIDFSVIWAGKPVLFKKDTVPVIIDLPTGLEGARLIDTGEPGEKTSDLVAWVKSRYESRPREASRSHSTNIQGSGMLSADIDQSSARDAIETIGKCTERILSGEPLREVMRDHHRAQVALGVVPESTQQMILDIEINGGSAKVIGAGARTGGGGMVLALPGASAQA